MRITHSANHASRHESGGDDAIDSLGATTFDGDVTLEADLKLEGSSSGVVTVGVAASAGTWTLQLPTDDGGSGEQLQTNGSGVSSWETA